MSPHGDIIKVARQQILQGIAELGSKSKTKSAFLMADPVDTEIKQDSFRGRSRFREGQQRAGKSLRRVRLHERYMAGNNDLLLLAF